MLTEKRDFHIGDKVRRINNSNGYMEVGDEGVITNTRIEGRTLFIRVKSENYTYEDEHDSKNLEIIDSKIIKSNKNNNMEKKKISFKIFRKNGSTFFEFECDSKFEAIFSAKKHEIRESTNWEGLKFYFIPEITNNEDYKHLLNKYGLKDDFGSEIYDDNMFNVAFLRTIGGKGTIKVNKDLSFSTVSEAIRNIVRFTKEYYESFIEDFEVKGSVNIEV